MLVYESRNALPQNVLVLTLERNFKAPTYLHALVKPQHSQMNCNRALKWTDDEGSKPAKPPHCALMASLVSEIHSETGAVIFLHVDPLESD